MNLSISEARKQLADLVNRVQYGGERVVVEKHGKPAAVMVSVAEVEYWEALEDRELSALVDAVYADPAYDPTDTVPAERFFAELDKADAAE